MSVSFTVYGEAKPAGALAIGTTNDGRRFLRHRGGADLNSWKRAIAGEAGDAVTGEPERGAVSVTISFYLARPTGHYGKRGLRPTAPAYPTKRSVGDVDKLTRAVLDALTGICFADDSQVVDLRVRKRYADGRSVSAEITVAALSDELDILATHQGLLEARKEPAA